MRGLHAGYPSRAVLRGVDLAVGEGEIVGLIGPNGCGKTTLLKAITSVVTPSAGEVWLLGDRAGGLSRREIARRCAVVPQGPTLPAGFTGLEVVLMGRTPHLGFLQQEGPADHRLAREALSTVGIEKLGQRPVDELSGGERQMVVLARALAQGAPILLLDEPTSNLDIGHQIALFELVREQASRSGRAVLAALHDLTLGSLHCDRIALMADGAIVALGRPDEVLTAENIRRAYGADVVILRDGRLPAPVVVPIGPPR